MKLSLENGLVLMAMHGSLVPLRVLSQDGDRLTLVDSNDTVHKVSPKRLYWISEHRAETHEELNTHWASIDELAHTVDIAALWESCADSHASEGLCPSVLAERAFGNQSSAAIDACILAAFRDGRHFKLRERLLRVTSAARIMAFNQAQEQQRQADQELSLVMNNLTARLDGLEETPVDATVMARHIKALIDTCLNGTEAADSALAVRLMDGLKRQAEAPTERAWKLLRALGIFRPYENLATHRAQLPQRFSTELLKDAQTIVDTRRESPKRRDLREVFTVSIDDQHTTEIDDAFALDGNRLLVFIADAAAFVKEGSVLDLEAARRAATVYLPEGKIPMLPSVISEQAASLNEGLVRPALCMSGEFAEDGRLVAFEICEAQCRIDRRLTYEDANALLEAPPETNESAALLQRAQRLLDRHRQWRDDRGAVNFLRQETIIEADLNKGVIALEQGQPNTPGRQLISEMMIALGVATAAYCDERAIPCVYRTQAPPQMPLQASQVRNASPSAQLSALRTFKPTVLTTKVKPHFSLGVDAYTQVTSPLRRYGDLIMHRQLKGFLRMGRAPMSAGQLQALCSVLEKETSAHRRVEFSSRRYWTLVYLSTNPDRSWPAVALRPVRQGWLVQLTSLTLQAVLKTSKKLREDQALTVGVQRVDPKEDRLTLTLLTS